MEKTSNSKESSDLFRKVHALPLSAEDRSRALGSLLAAERVARLVVTGLTWLGIFRHSTAVPKLKHQLVEARSR